MNTEGYVQNEGTLEFSPGSSYVISYRSRRTPVNQQGWGYRGKRLQLMDVIPKYKFRKIVDRHNGNYRVRRFACWDQLLCLYFGQLTFRKSLRYLTSTLNALDSTSIELCLSLVPWAGFRRKKAAIKLHTLMDLEGSIPAFIHISDGRTHDVNVLDMIPVISGSIYILDRGYLEFNSQSRKQLGLIDF